MNKPVPAKAVVLGGVLVMVFFIPAILSWLLAIIIALIALRILFLSRGI
jgi:hypothetical protein